MAQVSTEYVDRDARETCSKSAHKSAGMNAGLTVGWTVMVMWLAQKVKHMRSLIGPRHGTKFNNELVAGTARLLQQERPCALANKNCLTPLSRCQAA